MRTRFYLAVFLAALTPPPARADDLGKPVSAAERDHWAFRTPHRPPAPAVKTPAWVRNPVDAFILAALEENGLAPAAEADRPTLLRRLTFDLTGLPPTPAELDAFLADRGPAAYERVVDRLLASPRYGERWAQHWLDLARYADTDGFEYDAVRPDAWRYRDWVVAALNGDLPYDRFVRLQLAGDEVAPGDPGATVATGFNRCYPDMVDLNDQTLRRQNALNDITDTTGLVFLGLTVGCARCHDHKFDPIRQADFYRLQAFFTPARFRDDLPAGRPDLTALRDAWERQAADLRAALAAVEGPVRDLMTPAPRKGLDDETVRAFETPEAGRSPREVRLVLEAWAKDKRIRPEVWPVVLGPWGQALRSSLLSRLEHQKAAEPKPPRARGLDEDGPRAPPTYVLKRGELGQRGPEVVPAFPAVLRTDADGPVAALAPTARSTGRRTALADWLARPDHPLTARVIANRLWQHHFGRGIVATASDFGTMGAEPSHPALLDWLAAELPARGWSLKALHRLMVTSATYRQSSRAGREAEAIDPDNDLLSRYRRARLDGEAIRDALLAVSGELSGNMGGVPVFPALPGELAGTRGVAALWPVSDRAEERSRRSLYVFVRRNLRYPFFEAFDRPDTNASCPRRSGTTTAPQALTLLNSSVAHSAASAMADRLAREAGPDPDAQVRLGFRMVFGRAPLAQEMALARDFLARDPALVHLCLALLNANEFIYVD